MKKLTEQEIDNLYDQYLKMNQLAMSYYETIINRYKDKIKKTKSIKDLQNLYTYIQNISIAFFDNNNNNMNPAYRIILSAINECTSSLDNTYIIDSQPLTNTELIENKISLDILIKHTRLLLTKAAVASLSYYPRANINNIFKETLNNFSFINFCYESSKIVEQLCKKQKIPCKTIKLVPCFTNKEDLWDGTKLHYFNIITFNNEQYIVDCSYRQFFIKKYNCLEILGVVDSYGIMPGYIMLQDKTRQEVATQILKYGYIKLTPTTLKSYLDGFAMSYRNSNYYEQTQDFSFQTSYTSEIYEKFLRGEDNQLNYEDKRYLGKLKRPTKIKFS